MRKYYPVLAVLLAAFLWGIIGLFVNSLSSAGFSSLEIVALRTLFSCAFLLILSIFRQNTVLKVSYKDLPLFFGTGIVSIVFFNWCYFTAMNLLSVSTAVILLYTSPVFVMLFSALFFKEKVTARKCILLACTVAGIILIAGLKGNPFSTGSGLGYIIGIGSGIGYALYSIFGKLALRKYGSYTITFYTFTTAAIFLLPLTKLWGKAEAVIQIKNLIAIVGLSAISTVFAYLLYTWGLGQLEGSKAAVLSTVEPVTAMLLGICIFGETLSITQLLGAIIILAAAAAYSVLPSKCNRLIDEKGIEQ
ncbi:DMT family transporter [Peribacillus sp. SCS-155]|uniref:DMT family transporter n=1 Tax=Peribacillus sedimenti TaxID=3115297 RepID=UPI003906846D